MTIQEATKIVDKYCDENNNYRKAVYGGVFEGNHLFSLDFKGSGHHGTPLFIIIKQDGTVRKLEKHTQIFYRAWHSSNDYVDSLKRT